MHGLIGGVVLDWTSVADEIVWTSEADIETDSRHTRSPGGTLLPRWLRMDHADAPRRRKQHAGPKAFSRTEERLRTAQRSQLPPP